MGNYRTSPGDILSMLDGESVWAEVSPKKALDAGGFISQLPLGSGLPTPTKDPLDFGGTQIHCLFGCSQPEEPADIHGSIHPAALRQTK